MLLSVSPDELPPRIRGFPHDVNAGAVVAIRFDPDAHDWSAPCNPDSDSGSLSSVQTAQSDQALQSAVMITG
jgi:hypothetical protein